MYITLLNAARKIMAVMFTCVLLIVNKSDIPEKAGFIQPEETRTTVMLEALYRGQGITTDGQYLYFSSLDSILKTELDGETVVAVNTFAIPAKLALEGCNHIGGISYMNGYVYATTENSGDHDVVYMLRFDAETLKIDLYNRMPSDKHLKGAPWCVADEERNVIYSARRDRPEELNVYNPDTLEYMYSVAITGEPHKIQGGEIYDDVLYCAASRQNGAIFAIDLKTGEGKLIAERALNDDAEGEDLTILKTDKGVKFLMLDICSVRLGVNLRTYDFEQFVK